MSADFMTPILVPAAGGESRYAKNGFRKIMMDLIPGANSGRINFRPQLMRVTGVAVLEWKKLDVAECQAMYEWLLHHDAIPEHIASYVDASAKQNQVRLTEKVEPLDESLLERGSPRWSFAFSSDAAATSLVHIPYLANIVCCSI